MTQYGMDALNALNDTGTGGTSNEFNSFKTGTTYKVKVVGTDAIMTFDSYGIYKVVNSFSAKNPSKKSAAGYPVDNYTPWDRAWKFHRDLSEDFSDAHGQEASKYRPKRRFAMGFYDLATGELIVVDLSKNQAQAVHSVIKKYEKKLGKMAFELSKQGSGTSTSVSLTPLIDLDDDLTDEERKHFDKAPAEFDMSRFDGILYEADEDEQIRLLKQAGFDVTLIGYDANAGGSPAQDDDATGEDSLPF